MIDLGTADDLDRLAQRIARIRPMSNGNPEAFYEERSEVASEIRALAMRLRNLPEAGTTIGASLPAIGHQVVTHETRSVGGRSFQVLTRRAAARSGS